MFLFFYSQGGSMQKKEQSSRQVVMCYLMNTMGVDLDKARQLISDLEDSGLVRFDKKGSINVLLLEG